MKAARICLSLLLIPAGAGLISMTGCASTPPTETEKVDMATQAKTELQIMEHDSQDVTDAVNGSYGYAIFPAVGKGGFGIEGGGGYGSVYQQGQYYGTANLQMGGIGLTAGGETYSELLIFQTKDAFDNFTNAGLKFDAAASAVAIQAGASAKPKFQNGTAVYVRNTKGLMFDASIGGQQITVKPAKSVPTTEPAMAPAAPAPAPSNGM